MMSPEDSSNHSASLSSSHNNNPDEENKDAHNSNMAKEESFAATTASAVLATATATTTTVDDTAVDNQLPEEAKEAKTTMMADTAMAMQEDTAATVADTTRMATRNKNSNNNNNTEETASSVQQQQQQEDLTETSSSAAMEDISLTGHSIRDNDPKDKEEEEVIQVLAAAAEETKDTLVPLAATTTTTRTAAAHRAAPDIVPLEKDDDDDDVNNEETTTTPNPPELLEGCESMTSASSIITPSASAASFEAPNSNNNSNNNEQQQQQQQHHLPPGIQFEQCLYGFSNVIAQAEAAAEANQNEEQDNDDDHHHHHHRRHFVLDDWDYIREPYLWKSQQHHTISMSHLRKMASQQGIPDEGSHRAVTWRVLLGYLPPDNSQWDSTLQQKRSLYKSFVKDLFHYVPDCLTNGDDLRWKRKVPNRGKQPVAAGFAAGAGGEMATNGSESSTEDHHTTATATTTAGGSASPEHPSSPSSGKQQSQKQQQQALDSDSDRSQSTAPHDFGTEHAISPIPSPIKAKWKEKSGLDLHILDNLMKNMNALQLKDLHEIDDDTVVSDARFYDFADSARLIDEIRKDVIRTFPDLAFFLDPDENLGKRRYAALERILFVWAKYNKGVKYVQGMNEIVGTVYYVLANDWNAEWAAEAEADTYWLFHTLMTDMQDVFVPDLDDADTGIQGRIEMMESLLRRHDPEVKEHLEDVGVECSFFAIRWWTTLLSREFLLPDTIRLWDSMFASTHKDNFLCYLCVTMVIMIREDLLKGDFSRCLRLLQGYPPVMMDRLLESSRSLWVYERQITMACHKGGISLHQALQAVPPPDSIIMAFGFRNGVMPKTRAERLEEVGERAATSVREATSVVKASAKGWLGRASRFYNKYSQEYSNRARSRSSDSIRSERGSEPDSLVAESLPDDMDVYMDAISNAETGKWNYGSPSTRKD